MGDEYLVGGGADEAANAIQALFDKGPQVQAPEPEDETPAPAAEAAPVEAAPAVEEETQTPDEVAAEAEPAEPSQEENPTPVITKAPEPAPVAPKVADAPAQDKLTATTELLTQLNTLVPQIQARMAAAFPDIKTFDDLEKLAAEDPARYFQYDVLSKRLTEATQAQARASAEYRAHWTQQEAVKLGNLLPEWNDPVKGPALKQSLTDFAKEVGYSDAQIAQAGASDIVLLRDAMQFREAKKQEQAKAVAHAAALKEAQKKAANAPPVQKPGVTRQTDKGTEKIKELEERLSKTGHLDDVAMLLSAKGY
jgi:hypothetical protein